jgi:hypothetical protein
VAIVPRNTVEPITRADALRCHRFSSPTPFAFHRDLTHPQPTFTASYHAVVTVKSNLAWSQIRVYHFDRVKDI